MDHSHYHHESTPNTHIGPDDPPPEMHHQAHDASHSKAAPMHDKHAGHHTADFLKRFWVCLGLTLPLLLLSPMIQHWLGFHLTFPASKYLLLGLGCIIYFF